MSAFGEIEAEIFGGEDPVEVPTSNREAMQVIPAGIEINTQSVLIPSGWPTLSEEAYYGPLGKAVKAYAPYSEADPAAVLVSLLAHVGVLMGRGPHLYISDQIHRANLFALLIGPTHDGRKGTAGVTATRLLGESGKVRDLRGLGSGEAIVARLSDPSMQGQPALLVEEEFARVLDVARRNGSTLSAFIRMMFDGRTLSRLNVDEEQNVTDYHVGMIGHITPDELRLMLSANDQVNGLANRFLMVASHRRQRVIWFSPPGAPRPDLLTSVGGGLAATAIAGRNAGRVSLSESAKKQMVELYFNGGLESNSSLTARLMQHLCRLVLIFAVMDGGACVEPVHINAALAVVRYCESTVQMVFPASSTFTADAKIFQIIAGRGTVGVTRSELSGLLANHLTSAKRDEVINRLLEGGRIVTQSEPGAGRTAIRFIAREESPHGRHNETDLSVMRNGESK